MKIITLSGEGAGGLRRDAHVSPHVLQRQRRRLRRRAVVGIVSSHQLDGNLGYPLVNIQKTMENHHV